MWACRARQRCVAAPRCKHALHTCTACASALAWTFPHPRLRARQPLCSPRSRTRVRARTRTDAGASGAHKLVAGALGTLVSRSRSAPRRPGRAVEALGVSRQRSIYRHVSLCACSICLHVHMYAYMHFYIWYRSVFVCVFQYVCMHACMYRSIYLFIYRFSCGRRAFLARAAAFCGEIPRSIFAGVSLFAGVCVISLSYAHSLSPSVLHMYWS